MLDCHASPVLRDVREAMVVKAMTSSVIFPSATKLATDVLKHATLKNMFLILAAACQFLSRSVQLCTQQCYSLPQRIKRIKTLFKTAAPVANISNMQLNYVKTQNGGGALRSEG